MISEISINILIRLLAAHLLADFFLQTHRGVRLKRIGIYSPLFHLHIFTVGLLTYLLLADWTEWFVPVFIMITHFFIDWWKINQKDSLWSFLADQTAHLLMILLAWSWYEDSTGLLLILESALSNHDFWIYITGYAAVMRPTGFFIEKSTLFWRDELTEKNGENPAGLANAGTWIGYLERVIILTLVLIGQFSAIGFLIAAKSIFRFSGRENKRDRREAEYILIGTLLSFTLAILLGILMNYLLSLN